MNTYCASLVFNSEHQDLLKKIQQTQNSKVREDLKQELDWLVKQMEVKGEQISKLKKHQATVRINRELSLAGNTLAGGCHDCLLLSVNQNVTGMLKLGCSTVGDYH